MNLPQQCTICSSEHVAHYFMKKGRDIYTCSDCGAGFVHPLPSIDECSLYYDSEYARGRYRHRLTPPSEELKAMTCRMRAKLLKEYLPSPGKVLDIGCSSGTFLSVMEREGWDIFGIDISQESCRHAMDRWKERIRVFSLENNASQGQGKAQRLEGQPFDLITIFDTLEHSPKPRKLLQEAGKLLRPGGLLVITTHDFGSIAKKILGRWWSYLDPLEHLFYFSPESLGAVVRAEDLTLLKMKRAGKFVSLAFLLGEFEYSNPGVFRLLSPLLGAFVPASILLRPFHLYMGEIMVLCSKPGGSEACGETSG